jgi:hypothetical protein
MGANPLYLKFKAFAKFYMEQAGASGISLTDIRNTTRQDIYGPIETAIVRAEEAYRKDDARGVDINLEAAKKAYLRGILGVQKLQQHLGG